MRAALAPFPQELESGGLLESKLESKSASDGFHLLIKRAKAEAWRQSLAGMVGEVKYLGPMTAAGIIMITSGPVGAMVSALVAAGLTGVALRELLDDIKATPHTEAFARALEGGAVLLWARAETAGRQAEAGEILNRHGAADVHSHTRAQKA